MWETILQGIGGGLQGGLEGYRWMQDQRLKEKAIDVRAQMAALAQEYGLLKTGVTADSRVAAAEIGAGSREKVATIGADSRVKVADIGATSRENVARTAADASRYGADQRLFGDLFQTTTQRDIAGMRDTTTRRGQDITSRDRRYGVDTGRQNVLDRLAQDDYQFGEDMRFDTWSEQNKNWRDVNGPTGGGGVQWSDPNAPPAPGAPPPPAPPLPPAPRPRSSVTAPAAPTGGAPALRSQLQVALQAVKTAPDDATRTKALAELKRLRDAYAAATQAR